MTFSRLLLAMTSLVLTGVSYTPVTYAGGNAGSTAPSGATTTLPASPSTVSPSGSQPGTGNSGALPAATPGTATPSDGHINRPTTPLDHDLNRPINPSRKGMNEQVDPTKPKGSINSVAPGSDCYTVEGQPATARDCPPTPNAR